jgi:hypothetical protein
VQSTKLRMSETVRYYGNVHSRYRYREDITVTDPTQRDTRPSTDKPVMGDHPELETEDLPHAEPIGNDGGRPTMLIVGLAALVLVAIVILLVFI